MYYGNASEQAGISIAQRLTLLAVAVSVLLSQGCATTTGQDLNLLSPQEEAQIGKQFSAEVEKESKVLQNPAIQAYVQRVGQRLAAMSPRQNDVQYTFEVIDAPDTVNAFALPGGYIYVYTGLLRLCENEAELAAVMAHEIGHVAAYHHGEAITRQVGFSMLAELALGENPGAAAQVLSTLVGNGVGAAYSREQERQADQLGMDILVRAGYRPDAMVTFMQKLQAEDQKSGGSAAGLPIFASHPPTDERLQRLQMQLQQYPAPGWANADLNEKGYQKDIVKPLGGSPPKEQPGTWKVLKKESGRVQ